MKKIQKCLPLITIFCITLILLLIGEDAMAQCPMCRGAAEANLREGGKHALGLNRGILYLFLTPYVLVCMIASAWYWHYRKSLKLRVEN